MYNMAEASLKRLLPDDYLQNGESAQKKIRSNNGSPVPAPAANAANKPDVSKIMADVGIFRVYISSSRPMLEFLDMFQGSVCPFEQAMLNY